jgi:hypothetical protein
VSRLPFGLWALTVLFLAAMAVLAAVQPSAFFETGGTAVVLTVSIFLLATASVGALVAARRPGNPIGWLLLAAAVTTAGAAGTGLYSDYALDVGRSLPATTAARWMSDWLWSAAPALGGILPLLLFPTGRLPDRRRRWRGVAWLAIAACGLTAFTIAFMPGRFSGYTLTNPLGIPGAAGILEALQVVATIALVAAFLGAVASLEARRRRASAREREQLKWLAYAAALIVVAIPASAAVKELSAPASYVVQYLGLSLYPLALGVAILRQHLWDIDVVVNRTLVYGALTAILAAAYLGSVLLLQLALDPVTSGSSLAVAVSTLAVAALFRPARARIQAVVDKRFYRHRYDARQTLEDFSARLREQVDLEALGGELREVVRDTMQPAHVSLWLRGAGR